jgi:Cytochrome P460
MNTIRGFVYTGLIAIAALAVGVAANHHIPVVNAGSQAATFNSKGELQRPRGYRTWVFIGTPLTPNDMNGGHAAFPEFHNVYIDPASYEYYTQHGDFRDGSVIVKELVSVGSKAAASGKGYFEGEYLGVEAVVKDKSRFPNEPGNWAFFRFTDEEAANQGRSAPPKKVAKAAPRSACSSCHQPGAAQDSIFTQYYPVLRAAKAYQGVPEDK